MFGTGLWVQNKNEPVVCGLFYDGADSPMGLLPDIYNYRLRMRRECREPFPRHRRQRKPQVSDPGMHHGTCVTHVPWCMPGSLIRDGRENVPGFPGECNPQFCVSGKRLMRETQRTRRRPGCRCSRIWWLGRSWRYMVADWIGVWAWSISVHSSSFQIYW